MFDIKGKVALITGGASGIGFEITKALLRKDLRACTIVDLNEKYGQDALEQVNLEFGPNKAIFVKADVTDKAQFEAAFDTTIKSFRNVDILVNNAGILGEENWEETLQTNINGVINGILLGIDHYLPKYKSGNEGVIVNVASIVAIDSFNAFPVYTCTKWAVLGLTRAFGAEMHCNRSTVKVLAICPGITDTPFCTYDICKLRTLGPEYVKIILETQNLPTQPPAFVGSALVDIIQLGEPGSVWIAEGGEPPYEIDFATRLELRKD